MVKLLKSSSYKNLEYLITNINKRRGGRVLIFSNLKGGKCFFLSNLEWSVITYSPKLNLNPKPQGGEV